MLTVIYLSMVNGAIAYTVSETKFFRPFREWMQKKNNFLGEMLTCGYCFGHWTSFILVIIYQTRLFQGWWLLDYFLTALVIAWLSAWQWVGMCWLMQKVGK